MILLYIDIFFLAIIKCDDQFWYYSNFFEDNEKKIYLNLIHQNKRIRFKLSMFIFYIIFYNYFHMIVFFPNILEKQNITKSW